ncbi:unnamed protein product [Schistocephalus solidus]|uniref:Gag-pol polyprotein n=1 Tax=Schistocephalus solidus TaxID=70667 RepID=A0A183TQZ6_SCHSO|nr:unnamed protein product [Schistocephalus solidus]
MERVSSSGGRPPKPDKHTVYDDYDMWEDRMKVYLEAGDEGVRRAAILERLDNELYTVARAANLTASLPPRPSSSICGVNSDGPRCLGLPVPPSKVAENTQAILS